MTCLSHHESLPSLQAKAHDYQAIELNQAIGLGIGKLSLGIVSFLSAFVSFPLALVSFLHSLT